MSHGKLGAIGLVLSACVACAPFKSIVKTIDMTTEKCIELVKALGGDDSAEVQAACATASTIDDLIAAQKASQARRLAAAKDAGVADQ